MRATCAPLCSLCRSSAHLHPCGRQPSIIHLSSATMKTALLLLLSAAARAALATVLWDGRFNDLTTASDLDKWSWADQVGPYQYYIHGPGSTDEYVALSASYKNPGDTASRQGARLRLDNTSYWNGQTMRRTELIPQTSAPINAGTVFYHFSLMRADAAAPSQDREHQICFFESHFTELKYGWLSGEAGTADPYLQWMTSQNAHWKTPWEAGVWHNVAYEIVRLALFFFSFFFFLFFFFATLPMLLDGRTDSPAAVGPHPGQNFSGNTVGLWHSTGADPLTQVVAPVSAPTSSNGADWHLGVLELPRAGYPDATEDMYFSGAYIETGPITTAISGPGERSGAPVLMSCVAGG